MHVSPSDTPTAETPTPSMTGHGDAAGMWTHFCKRENCWISVGAGERCNWCQQGEPGAHARAQAQAAGPFTELIERLRRGEPSLPSH
jgi:hypothetical protein